jgi:hypothetical protein
MKFSLKCLYENGAMLTLPELVLAPAHIGSLIFEPLRRYGDGAQMAHFMTSANGGECEIVPPLMHAVLGPPFNDALTVQGFEMCAGKRIRQCWLLVPVPAVIES